MTGARHGLAGKMAQSAIQTAFHAGEWAPPLNARVDLAKYHSAAALLYNFFVDYRGGASSRPGTRYILQCFKSASTVRLIPFQASFSVGYVLEFGDGYIRFYNNGSPVLETAIAITAATKANPCVLSVANTFAVGDWVYVTGVVGMTQLNGNYYKISARTGGTITLADLNGVAIDSTGYGTYTSGGTAARVYTLTSPYASGDLSLIKFAQNLSTMILCQPNYPVKVLTLITAANWTIASVSFGSTIAAPSSPSIASTLSAGGVNYAYAVTAVDDTGQESAPAVAALASKQDLRTVAGTNRFTWGAPATVSVTSYNVYKAEVSYAAAVLAGAQYGFIGNVTGRLNQGFDDSNIAPDYSQTIPISNNPFAGAGVSSVAVTAPGAYTTSPSVIFAAGAGTTATGIANMYSKSGTVSSGGIIDGLGGYHVGDTILLPGSIIFQVTSIDTFTGLVTGIALVQTGYVTGALPSNPLAQISSSGTGKGCTINLVWGVSTITVTSPGSGYGGAPAVTFSGGGGAAATATLGTASLGNPSVPTFFQQRLVLASQVLAPQTFYMSQPGSPYNFDVSNPIQADDSITGTLASGRLNEIRAMVSMPSGLIMLSNDGSWLINGGANGTAVAPSAIVANPQSFNGISNVPPIVANFDILFVQAKNSIVRDLSYNFYANVWTGTDISVLSSHLFYGYTINEWAWAEEPFKTVWAIRNDGIMLTLTFLKEQELIGWAHSNTQGLFNSVAVITEQVSYGSVDAVYTAVQRTVNGNVVQYVERLTERIYPNGATDAWCVDAGLQYRGAAASSFTGAQHLAGMTVTGLADGVVIPSFTMPTNGNFTITTAASVVTVGLAYTPQLQTLAIDLGDPTVQGKRKKITAVTVRVAETLGLSIGKTFDTLVPMKDLVVGNVGSATNEVVMGLVTADARTIIDPSWDVPGQYCIQQSYPLPATILGVIPEIVVGDTPK